MAIISISGKIGSGKDTVGTIIQQLSFGSTTKEIVEHINGYTIHILNSKWEIKKFAYKLKQIVSLLTGIPVNDLERQDVKDSVLGEEWSKTLMSKQVSVDKEEDFFKLLQSNKDWIYKGQAPHAYGKQWTYSYYLQKENYTVRWLLQRIGTEAMRDVIHPNVWINALFSDYKRTIEYQGQTLDATNDKSGKWGKYPNWIITDTRFPNELKAVKDRGGISIRINTARFEDVDGNIRFGYEQEVRDIFDKFTTRVAFPILPKKEHPSETALDNATFDYVIDNNSTIEDLIEQVKQILIKEKII